MLLAQEYVPDLSEYKDRFMRTPLGLLTQGNVSGAVDRLGADAQGRVQAMSSPETALQTGMDFMGGGLLGTTKLVNKTQMELANEIASKNAETMLGLPKGNTAMDRAKAMGFDTKNMWFRGDKPNLKEFDAYDNDAYIKGNTFLTNKKDIAKYYSRTPQSKNLMRDANSYDESEGVYSLFVKKNPDELKANARNQSWASIKVPKELKDIETYDGTIQIDDLGEIARKRNYPSAQINNVLDQYGYGNQKIIFNPSDIRSINAAFDPARANESDILAGMIALPVGSLLQEPEKKKNK